MAEPGMINMDQIKISSNLDFKLRSGYCYFRLLSLLLFLSSVLYAQSATATLHGLIIDEQGAVISGVEITLLNKSKALARQITTGDDGGFTFALLPPDIYLIRARRDGFVPVEIENVKINH